MPLQQELRDPLTHYHGLAAFFALALANLTTKPSMVYTILLCYWEQDVRPRLFLVSE